MTIRLNYVQEAVVGVMKAGYEAFEMIAEASQPNTTHDGSWRQRVRTALGQLHEKGIVRFAVPIGQDNWALTDKGRAL